jgi:hypothetical protein
MLPQRMLPQEIGKSVRMQFIEELEDDYKYLGGTIKNFTYNGVRTPLPTMSEKDMRLRIIKLEKELEDTRNRKNRIDEALDWLNYEVNTINDLSVEEFAANYIFREKSSEIKFAGLLEKYLKWREINYPNVPEPTQQQIYNKFVIILSTDNDGSWYNVICKYQ